MTMGTFRIILSNTGRSWVLFLGGIEPEPEIVVVNPEPLVTIEVTSEGYLVLLGVVTTAWKMAWKNRFRCWLS